jgi:hypothetical protein
MPPSDGMVCIQSIRTTFMIDIVGRFTALPNGVKLAGAIRLGI